MQQILHSPVSVVHFISALLALVLGTYGWLQPKATRQHRQLGYAYVGCMLVLLTTAFNIYHLFGYFGVVHWGAVGASASLTVGVFSAVARWPRRSWPLWHYLGMGGSLLGLYTTFVVESTYRLFPARYFWWTTFGTGSVLIIFGLGLLIYKVWRRKTGKEEKRRMYQPARSFSLPPFLLFAFVYLHTATGALMAGYGS